MHQLRGPPMGVGCHALSTHLESNYKGFGATCTTSSTSLVCKVATVRARIASSRCARTASSARATKSHSIWDKRLLRSKLVPGFSKFVLHFIANLQRRGNCIMETETQQTNSIRQIARPFIVIQQRKRILAAKSKNRVRAFGGVRATTPHRDMEQCR